MPAIDYTALQAVETTYQRRRWAKIYASHNARPIPALGIVVAAVAVSAQIVVFMFLAQFSALTVCLILEVIIAVVVTLQTSRKKARAVLQFATDNDWQVADKSPGFYLNSLTPYDDDGEAKSMLGLPLGERSFTNVTIDPPVLMGALQGCPFWLYEYEYILTRYREGSDKPPRQRVARFAVLSIALPAGLPVFFLDAVADGRQEQRNRYFENGLEQLSLEGDFDNYFTLWQEPKTELDILTIVTPEFMQLLVQSGAYLNIESDGEYLHVISSYGSLGDYTPMSYLLRNAEAVLERILFKLTSYHP